MALSSLPCAASRRPVHSGRDSDVIASSCDTISGSIFTAPPRCDCDGFDLDGGFVILGLDKLYYRFYFRIFNFLFIHQIVSYNHSFDVKNFVRFRSCHKFGIFFILFDKSRGTKSKYVSSVLN